MDLIVRKNKMFVIEESELPEEARNSVTINALYEAIWDEFRGAINNENYRNLTVQQRIEQINIYARKWLNRRGFKDVKK